MAKKSDLREELRREARDIFNHAGAFLMRTIAERIAALMTAAARHIADLEQRKAKLESDVLHLSADLSGAEGRIEELEAELQASRAPGGEGEA